MRRVSESIFAPLVILAGLGMVGCGGSPTATKEGEKPGETAPASTAATEGAASQTELSITPDSTPDEVVIAFLEARKSGDTKATSALLTSVARRETARHKIDVNNQAVPDLQFQVAKPKYLKDNKNGSHVSSIWTESLEDGSKVSYEIVWVLRRETDGWRVAGFAAELIPGTQPQFLNFEDPADMIRKQEEAMAMAQKEEEARVAEQTKNSPDEGGAVRPR